MTATTVSIEKKIEKIMEDLGPDELARYVTEEMNNAINRQLAGEEASSDLRRINEAIKGYASKLSNPDYSRFWWAMWREEQNRFIRHVLQSDIPALDRERSLHFLLMIALCREWSGIKCKKDKKSAVRRKKIIEHISLSLTKYREISNQLDSFLKDDIWVNKGISCPVIDNVPGVSLIIEEVEEIVNNYDQRQCVNKAKFEDVLSSSFQI